MAPYTVVGAGTEKREGACGGTGRSGSTRWRWAVGIEAAEVDDVVGLAARSIANEMTVRPE
jgi:hypothetical protein